MLCADPYPPQPPGVRISAGPGSSAYPHYPSVQRAPPPSPHLQQISPGPQAPGRAAGGDEEATVNPLAQAQPVQPTQHYNNPFQRGLMPGAGFPGEAKAGVDVNSPLTIRDVTEVEDSQRPLPQGRLHHQRSQSHS